MNVYGALIGHHRCQADMPQRVGPPPCACAASAEAGVCISMWSATSVNGVPAFMGAVNGVWCSPAAHAMLRSSFSPTQSYRDKTASDMKAFCKGKVASCCARWPAVVARQMPRGCCKSMMGRVNACCSDNEMKNSKNGGETSC